MTAASFPRPPFRDVGSLKSHELYAFAGLVPQMPESIRQIIRDSVACAAVDANSTAAGCRVYGNIEGEREAMTWDSECRAILEAMETNRG